jgi:hypothetical protein
MKIVLRLFKTLGLLGLNFADDVDLGLGTGGEEAAPVTEAVVAKESSAIASEGAKEDLTGEPAEKSDWDILNEDDEPIAKEKEDETDDDKKEAEAEDVDETPAAKKEREDLAAKTAKELADKKGPVEVEEPGVKALKAAIDKDAALKAALDKNPNLRNKLFTDARRSARLTGYQEHFATPELAKLASSDLQYFDGFEKAYTDPAPESPKQLLTKLLEADFERGADGKQVLENGQPKLNGNYSRLMTSYRQEGLYPMLEGRAQEIANMSPEQQVAILGEEFDADTFQAGMKLLKALTGDARPAKGKQKTSAADNGGENEEFDESQLPEHVRKTLANARSAETQQREGQGKEQAAFQTAIKDGIQTSSKETIKGRVDVAAKAFTDGTRAKIIDDAYSRIAKIAGADTAYKRQQKDIMRSYQGDEQKTRLVNAAKVYVAERMTPIVRELVSEYGKGAIKTNKDTHEKAVKQAERKEPITRGGDTKPTRQGEMQLVQRAEKLTRDLYGRGLKETEVMDVDEDFVANLERRQRERKTR